MIMEIRPHEGAGSIQFGMTRNDVCIRLHLAPRRFKRSPGAKNETDAFDDEGIYVEYDKSDICEAIEIARPAVPILLGRNILEEPFSDLRDWFLNIDLEAQVDEAGLTSPRFGVGLYAPSAQKSPAEPVEAVIIFCRGYYEK